MERDFPFGIVRQLFESHVVSESERSRLLSGAAAAAAPVFGLDGGVRGASLPTREPLPCAWILLPTVNLCSDRPLLLAVDDLPVPQRLGTVPRLPGAAADDLPVALVGSLRSWEPEADQAALEELASEPHAQVLMPGPLTAAAVAEVMGYRLGEEVDSAFADACHSSTDANPLLLNELLKTLAADRVQPDAAHAHVVAELGPRAASRAVCSAWRAFHPTLYRQREQSPCSATEPSSPSRRRSRSSMLFRLPPPPRPRACGDPAARPAARFRARAGSGGRLPRSRSGRA